MSSFARLRNSMSLAALASTLLLSACTGPTELPPEDEIVQDVDADASPAVDTGSESGDADVAASTESPEDPLQVVVSEPIPAVCPESEVRSESFVNQADGYCLLYPSELRINLPDPGLGIHIATISRPPANAYQSEIKDTSLSIEISEIESGADLGTLVDERLSDYAAVSGSMVRSEMTIAGLPAIVVDGVPGMWTNRQAYMMRGDKLVKLLVAPWQDEALADKQAGSERLWEMVTSSLTFFDAAGETSADDADAADMGSTPPEGPLSVSEVLNFGPGPVVATGFVVEVEGLARLCDALAESFPPQCGGSSIPLDGINLDTLDSVAAEGAVRWTDEAVEVGGQLLDGTFVVAASSGD